MSSNQTQLILKNKGFTDEMARQVLQSKSLVRQEAKASAGSLLFSEAQDASTLSTFSLSNVLGGFVSVLGSTTAKVNIAMAAVTAAVAIWQKYKQAQEEARQTAETEANSYMETTQSVSGYVKKYQELHDALLNAAGDEEETYKIKKQLLDLQLNINEAFGDEYGKINLVSDAYKNLVHAIREYKKNAAEQFLSDNEGEIKRATKKMTEPDSFDLGIHINENTKTGADILDVAKKYESRGVESIPDGGIGSYTIHLSADPREAQVTIKDFWADIDHLLADKKSYNESEIFNIEDVLEQSSTSLSKSEKTIEQFRTTYLAGLSSTATLSDELGEDFMALGDAVDYYIDALASGDESEILKAWEDFDEIRNRIDLTSEEWLPFADAVTEQFNRADTGIYDFREDVKKNQDGVSDIIRQFQGEEDVNLLAEADSEQAEALIKLAEKYRLSIRDIVDELIQMKVITGELSSNEQDRKEPLSYSETIDELNKMKDSFFSMSSSYDKFMTKSGSFGDLWALKDTFKDVSGIENYIRAIQEAKDDTQAVQKAFHGLSAAYLDSTGILDQVTDENAQLIATMLEESGVANANSLVYGNLAVNKKEAQLATLDLSNASYDGIIAFTDETESSDEARQAILRYYLEKLTANGITMATDGDIQNITALIRKLGGSTRAIEAYNNARKSYDQSLENYQEENLKIIGSPLHPVVKGLKLLNQKDQQSKDQKALDLDLDLKLKEANEEIEQALQTPVEYSGNARNSMNPNSGNSSSPKERQEPKEFDWFKRRSDYLQAQHDEFQKIVEDETDSYTEQLDAIEHLIEADKRRIEFSGQAAESATAAWERAKQDLTNDEISKIMEGGISEESYDPQRAEFIQKAMDLYDKKAELEKEASELTGEVNEHLRDEVRLRGEIIEAQQKELSGQMDLTQSKMELMESRGQIVTERMLSSQSRLNEDLIGAYEDQMANLYDQIDFVDQESAEYYKLMAQIDGCEDSIAKCRIQQEEWNEKIRRLPIERIEKYLAMLGYIKQDLQNFMEQQSSLNISATKDQYQQLIQISREEIKKLVEQQGKLVELLSRYQYGSEKYADAAGEIQDIDNEISSIIQSQNDWNTAILQIPVDKITEADSRLQAASKAMEDIISDCDTALSAVIGEIDRQVDSVNQLKTSAEEAYSEKIEPLQKELDLLKKQNDERQIQLDLENAKYHLDRAISQKNIKIIQNGEIEYTADYDSVRDASQEKADAEYQKIIYKLGTQIGDLEEERNDILEGYDSQIEKLDVIKERWDSISKDMKLAAESLKADQILGDGWRDKISVGNDAELFSRFKEMYSSISWQNTQVKEQIASNERIAEMMNTFITQWQNGSLTFEQAMAGIKDLAAKMQNGFTGSEQLQSLLNMTGQKDISSLLLQAQTAAGDSVSQLAQYMKIVKENSDAMTGYTSSWNDMREDIKKQMEALRKAAESLEKISKNHSVSSGGSGGFGGGHTSPPGSTGSYEAAGPGFINDVLSGKQEAVDSWNSGNTGGAGSSLQQTINEKLQSKHGGIQSGLVRGSDRNREKLLRQIATEDLRPNEEYIKALQGEAVLTVGQQETLLDNFTAVSGIDPAARAMSLLPSVIPSFENPGQPPSVAVNIGDIVLQNVENADELAQNLEMNFDPIMRQYFSKLYKN